MDRRATHIVAYNIVFSELVFCASEIRSRTALDATALGDLPSFLAMTMSGSCLLCEFPKLPNLIQTPLLLHDPWMTHLIEFLASKRAVPSKGLATD